MGGIDRHHNADYSGGLPLALNDRLWGQDWQRQFWYQMEQAGIIVKDTLGSNGLLSLGGSIVKGTNWDDIDIPEAIGYAEFDVTVQDEAQAWQVPALTKTVTLESIRVRTPAVADFDISGTTLDGSTTNYLKMAYAEADGRTRQKNNDPATWAFERVQSVLITANSTPATSKEVLLATFVGDGSSVLTITEEDPFLDAVKLKTKIIEIGDWDMDADGSVIIAHGLDITKIRDVAVMIRADTGNQVMFESFNYLDASDNQILQSVVVQSTIQLNRDANGFFDSTAYDTFPNYNRGWITIRYEI